MSALITLLAFLATATVLALRHAPLWKWAAAIGLLTLLAQSGAMGGEIWGIVILFGWLVTAALAALCAPSVYDRFVIDPAFRSLKKIMPSVSDTEKEALEAGTVGWDAELFSGAPDWSKLKSVAPITLTEEERAFLDGPTEELCRMLDDWEIRYERREIPDKIWKFVAEEGFLGMLISKEHGGLGFSAQAQSLIVGKIGSRSPDAAQATSGIRTNAAT